MAAGNASVLTTSGKGIVANRMKGLGVEPIYLAVGTGATGASRTAAVANTALTTERTTTRPTGISSIPSAGIYQVVATVTCSGGPWAIDELALFDSATGGNMFFSQTKSVTDNVESNDSVTYTIQFAA